MSASFVIDASVAMAWCFLEEATPATSELLDRMETETAAVPAWWFLEVTNVLALAERRGRITPAQVAGFIALVEDFGLEVDDQAPARAFTHLLPLCRSHGLTSYDAVYLDLALRRGLPLASLDEELRAAAEACGVKLLAI
ncbi:MAG TPA: type II toxin-antitoxin system VapC family toxin [Phycisphaerae bacterium]|nr:type II toxin-antitoxin system VapC family toxin [Phycisphaerae bacterium]HOJ53973.1 type II toxin-antitoxin system VapC family toxin [Phycisphaerae bacterium]HOL27522.1 type II toxin-antitoxin system VapC family toxin [Phycisphaerae bacterium]HPP22618.1 type II toxin-antitoxin system VapC family toxin [Phycisphaerae bacterium]HPU31771.1 type II toxin-antitoxin system VapC family toxin [Phycisphaerae bacterium]